MRRFWLCTVMATLLLSGCAAQPLETVSDDFTLMAEVPAREILLELPSEAVLPVMQREDGEKLYLCDGYELRLQTLPSGNLDGALRTITGMTAKDLTVMQTIAGENTRYDCSWCTVGEEGELVGRTAILDDGNYYYCVSALALTEDAGQLRDKWKNVFSTITLD